MATHHILKDGTSYAVSGGTSLMDGTKYQIGGGRTLIDGTVYEIGFAKPVTITITGNGYDSSYQVARGYVEYNGEIYCPDGTTIELQVNVGDKLTVVAGTSPGGEAYYPSISLNGTTVAKSNETNSVQYIYTATKNAAIHVAGWISGPWFISRVGITEE